MEHKRTMLICLTLVGGAFWRYVSCTESNPTVAAPPGQLGANRPSSQCTSSLSKAKDCVSYNILDSPEQLRKRLQTTGGLAPSDIKPAKPADGVDSSLQQVLLVHRHGDRTPVNFQPLDELKGEPFWGFFGLGQLTNRGKARTNLMGRLTRDRYDRFLNGSVNKNNRRSQSSGIVRCIESAQLFLASFLALDRKSSPDASELVWDGPDNKLGKLWQPASVLVVPVGLDGMLAEGAVCKNLNSEYTDKINQSAEVRQIFADYAFEAEQLRRLLGFKMTYFQEWFWASSLLEVERSYFPDKIRPELLAIYDRVVEAGNKCMSAYQSTPRSRRLRSGLLVQDILDQMRSYKAASATRLPFVHYSTHDLNLVSLLGVLGVWDQFKSRPDYASNVAFELHRDGQAQGGPEWFVRLFYTPQVPGETLELHVPGCGQSHPLGRCRLDVFERLLGEYALGSWQNWMQECGNNFSDLDPYQAARVQP